MLSGCEVKLGTTRVFFRWSCLRVLISPFRSILLICSFLFSCSCRPCRTLCASIRGTTAASCGRDAVIIQSSEHIQDTCHVNSTYPSPLCLLQPSQFLRPLAFFFHFVDFCGNISHSFSTLLQRQPTHFFRFVNLCPNFPCAIKLALITAGSKLLCCHRLTNWFPNVI